MSPSYQIAELIKAFPGFVVEMRGLAISRLREGNYLVSYETWQETFSNPYEAARRFIEKRTELKLGYDFDVGEAR